MLEAVRTQIESSEGVRKKQSLVIYAVIISCTCGCELRLSCMHPGRSPTLCLGNRAQSPVPLGAQKFGINILHGNGPPFAACHHKIGGCVLARVPPAEQGPVFLLCSMTPLVLSVDFLSPFIPSLLLSRSRQKQPHPIPFIC